MIVLRLLKCACFDDRPRNDSGFLLLVFRFCGFWICEICNKGNDSSNQPMYNINRRFHGCKFLPFDIFARWFYYNLDVYVTPCPSPYHTKNIIVATWNWKAKFIQSSILVGRSSPARLPAILASEFSWPNSEIEALPNHFFLPLLDIIVCYLVPRWPTMVECFGNSSKCVQCIQCV